MESYVMNSSIYSPVFTPLILWEIAAALNVGLRRYYAQARKVVIQPIQAYRFSLPN
jgi:hypothetical protein